MLCALAVLPLLSACGTVPFDTRQSTRLVLPEVVQYEQQLLDQAANEVEAGTAPALTELAKDYKVMRDQTRLAIEGLSDE